MKEVLYFSAEWCVPCKQMKPIVEKMAGDTGISFKRVDIESDYELAERHKVRSVPTFVLVEDGAEISRTIGAQTGKELAAALSL
jgi:thioredoxin 1